MDLAAPAATRTASTASYCESRHHELRKSRLLMVDFDLRQSSPLRILVSMDEPPSSRGPGKSRHAW